jgi:NAD(P)-dependent dehydrogenase (short-subunit alcohol dehydrogenase family)
MESFKGKVAICTGSGRHEGLGQAILKRLAKQGCKVVVSDIGVSKKNLAEHQVGVSEEMSQIVEEIRAAGGEAISIPCDVRLEEEVKALISATVDAYGRVDILINNAGIGYVMKSMDDLTLEEWNLVINVNLTGTFLCSKYAARQMSQQGDGGRIINIASQAAQTGFPHMAPYVASKHALIGLTRSNAIELGGEGITVNAICPNHVTTGLGAKQNEYFSDYLGMTVEAYLDAMRKRIPMGRPGLATDTAAAVAFLSSEDAQFITGEAMNVSGGEEMH